jgi:tRNA(fMet)-specific endonuclease VapC
MNPKAYLLDTDYVIDFLKGKPYASEIYKQVLSKAEIGISIITYAEVYEGIFYGRDRQEHEKNFLGFADHITIYNLTQSIARQYAIIRGNLRSQKTTKDLAEPKKYYDLFIATTALEYGLTLVTNNVKDYNRIIPYLQLYHPAQEAA